MTTCTNTKDKEESKEEMTPEERLEWLRERGVQITSPEERKMGLVAEALKSADALSSSSAAGGGGDDIIDDEEVISYVVVPHDSSKPLRQLTFQPGAVRKRLSSSTTAAAAASLNFGNDDDMLLHHLLPAFREKSDRVDLNLLQQQRQSTLLATPPGGDGNGGDRKIPEVSDASLRKVAEDGCVEIFTLVHPTPSNRHASIRMYLDEIGMLKRLPLNARASRFAESAGYVPPPQFYGDVYLARVVVVGAGGGTGGGRQRLRHGNFLLGMDTSDDATWLRSAADDNLQYQMERNRITGTNERQSALAGTDGKEQKETGGYGWTQTEEEIEIVVPLSTSPPEADGGDGDGGGTERQPTSAKDIKVQFRPQSIQVQCRKKPVLSIQLFERVDPDGCTWTFEKAPLPKIIVSMEKMEPALWPRIQD